MLVLGLDLETTGLDPLKDDIIELAAVVWDCDRQTPLKIYNEMVQTPKNLPEEITRLTGIIPQDLTNWGVSIQEALLHLESLAQKCHFIVAHNGREFDQLFIQKYLKSYSDIQITLPWIDTCTDLPYPNDLKTRKLAYLAAEHGFLNPFPHRSLFDVLTMMKVFSEYPIQQILDFTQSPMVRVVAQVSFDERDKAKAMGFRWDPQRKEWYNGLREAQIKQIKYPFPITCEML